jgi:DNA-binding XRE family transcriptional regulator
MPPEELTAGERLMLARRRRGENQTAAARRLGVPYSRYSLWERDELDGAPHEEVITIEPHEACLLHRRRAGVTQGYLAQELGCCRWWLNQMERGLVDNKSLVEYWGERVT